MGIAYIAYVLAFCGTSFAQSFSSAGSGYFYSGGSSADVQAPTACKNSCGNGTCRLQYNSQGLLENKCPSNTRYDVDPNCIMNQNAMPGSCLDTMPVAGIKRVSETNCYRANGAGGNSTPRNHLGTDYAATEGTVVTAAADGNVVFAKWLGGAGRAIIIEHEKKCQCTAGNANEGCDNKYLSVYFHLKAYKVTGGAVKRGQPIGIVGGSNYSSATGTACDYPNSVGNCKPYGPHLHFELHSGAWKGGYDKGAMKQNAVNPLCDDIQNFCGGCSYDVQKCQNKTSTNEWESLSDAAAEEKSAATAIGSMTPDAFGADSNTVYSALTGCSLEKYLPKTEECWFCPMFRVLFNTASTIALKAYTALAAGVANLVIVGFALWLSLVVLKHVSAMEVKNPRKLLQEILLQAFRVLIVVLILKISFFQVVQLTMEPVFNTGMAFSQTITGKGTYNSQNPEQQLSCPDNAEYMQNINGYDSKTGFTENSKGGLPTSMGKNIVCTIKSIQDSLGKMMAYGRQAICVAWGPKSWLFNLLPSFPYLITGIVIYLGGLVLLVAFPWCLIDCVLQMSIAAGLAPAAIGAWAFKITSRYLKMIWDFFMNAMFNFVFLSIIIYIIMTVVDQFMRRINEYAGENTGWDFLIHPIHGLAYWGVTGMQLVVVCLMGWVFLDEGKNFADKFAKAADVGGIGRSVGGAFAQAAKKTGGVAANIGDNIAKAGMQVGDHFIGSKIRKARNNYRTNKVMSNGKEIFDDEGNLTGYERTSRNILGQKVTRTVNIGSNGKLNWSKEKQSLYDKALNKINDEANEYRMNKLYEEGEQILDEDGNVIGYEMEHRNLLGQKVKLTATRDENGKWQINKQKHSLRMETLSKMSSEGSKARRFDQENAVFKDKSLNKESHASHKTSSDHIMTVHEYKDKSGNVTEREIKFNTNVSKYLVNKDGTLNMQLVNQIKEGSNFDEKTINEAIVQHVLRERGISINSKFKNRKTTFENGILHISQANNDGSVINLDMMIGGKNNNQMLTDVKITEENGSFIQSIDNGIQKKTISYRNGDKDEHINYEFAEEYHRRHHYVRPLNGQGNFAIGLDKDAAMFGFSQDDLEMHAEQVRTGREHIIEHE